jgi:hypothetical protein
VAHVGDELRFALARDLEFLNSSSEVAGSRLHLLEKARVLDYNDGLIGESLHKLDLLNGFTSRRPHPIAPIGTPSRKIGIPRYEL